MQSRWLLSWLQLQQMCRWTVDLHSIPRAGWTCSVRVLDRRSSAFSSPGWPSWCDDAPTGEISPWGEARPFSDPLRGRLRKVFAPTPQVAGTLRSIEFSYNKITETPGTRKWFGPVSRFFFYLRQHWMHMHMSETSLDTSYCHIHFLFWRILSQLTILLFSWRDTMTNTSVPIGHQTSLINIMVSQVPCVHKSDLQRLMQSSADIDGWSGRFQLRIHEQCHCGVLWPDDLPGEVP